MDIKKCEHCGDPAAVRVRMEFYGVDEWPWHRYACEKHIQIISDEMYAEATPIDGFKVVTTSPIMTEVQV